MATVTRFKSCNNRIKNLLKRTSTSDIPRFLDGHVHPRVLVVFSTVSVLLVSLRWSRPHRFVIAKGPVHLIFLHDTLELTVTRPRSQIWRNVAASWFIETTRQNVLPRSRHISANGTASNRSSTLRPSLRRSFRGSKMRYSGIATNFLPNIVHVSLFSTVARKAGTVAEVLGFWKPIQAQDRKRRGNSWREGLLSVQLQAYAGA